LRKAKGKLKVLVLDFVANCERIEMIDELAQGTRRAFEKLSPVTTGDSELEATERRLPLTLTVDGAAFDERLFKLFDVIGDIRGRGGYTREDLLEQLREKAQSLGRPPGRREVNDDPEMASDLTFRRILGTTWNGVLEQAGLTPQRNRYDAETLVAQLQTKAQKLGRPPSVEEIETDPDIASWSTFRNFFGGGWKDIMTAAKLLGDEQDEKQRLTALLLQKAEQLGRTPKRTEVDEDSSMPSGKKFLAVFETSWNGILETVGLQPRANIGLTAEELKEKLAAKANVLGRTPTIVEVENDPSMPSVNVFKRVLGTKVWAEIVKAAGLSPIRREYSRREPSAQ
jgi:hypothetical protein